MPTTKKNNLLEYKGHPLMRKENIIYYGDTSRVPYGTRGRDTIVKYARQDVAFLRQFDLKAIVIACNTVSSVALDLLAEENNIPIIGTVEPACRRAMTMTKNGRVGVIGTAATMRSGAYEKYLHKKDGTLRLFTQACPLFVPLVENGYIDFENKVTRLVLEDYLRPIRESGADTLILGCTHYPLIKTMIGEFMGRNVVLVDPAKTAAHHLERILSERGLKADHPAGQAHFYVSDAPDGFVQTADLFLGEYKGGEVEQIAIDKY